MDHWLTMPIDSKKHELVAYGTVYRCINCLFGAVIPRPRPEEIADFYNLDKYYTQGQSHFASQGRVDFWDRLRVHLAWRVDRGRVSAVEHIEALLQAKPAEICDIGTGAGTLAESLRALGHHVLAVDQDPKAAAYAASRGLKIVQGSAENLPPEVTLRRFDLVILSHVLEHCLDPCRAIENISELLRPGGLLYCEVPNNACVGFANAGLAWEMLDIPRHLNFFIPTNLPVIATRVGLVPQSMYFTGYTRQFKNDWINTERSIHDAIGRSRSYNEARPKPIRNSRSRAWALLARTAFADSESKYDSVGMVALKPI